MSREQIGRWYRNDPERRKCCICGKDRTYEELEEALIRFKAVLQAQARRVYCVECWDADYLRRTQ